MSWRYARRVRWMCDGCGRVEEGWEGELPAGWCTYGHKNKNVRIHPDEQYCPMCEPKEKP